ncbi:hypothetical protein FVE67_06370 [Thermosulfurimonas marina]|uniref:Uncharacterized protein n=1 Tax=Thermosulfurimonas marina TaxID=2047767 RepID=A0A6H1WTH2_9BACT|nr:hypothetical protein [Thermosulfurimonas marina]QJA06449.1 hypothetical protein FVE67_06370 [Thermosulfurimonas marina]
MLRRLLLALLVLALAFPLWALNYTDLYPYLPELPGFKASEPTGMKVATPGGEMVSAERNYEAGPRRLTARILMGQMAAGLWFPFAMQISYDTPEEKLESLKIEGLPAKRITHKKSPGGTLLVLLSREKTALPALFMLECQGMVPAEVEPLLKHFRLSELARKLNP